MTVTKPQNATLIDSISEGYAAINRRLWLVLVPILLNLYLWFGPQLSFGPLLTNFANMLKGLPPSMVDQNEMQPMLDQLIAVGSTDLRQQLAILNLVPTLRPYVIGAVDSDMGSAPAIQEVPQLIDPQRSAAISVSTVGGALLWFVLLNVLTLALSAAFLTQVGAAVRRSWLPGGGWRSTLRVGLALLGAIAVISGVALALGLPFMFFTYLLFFLSPVIGTIVSRLIWIVGFWVVIYIGFYPEAIVVGEQGPLRAIYTSFNVVRRNFWGTLGFLAISLIISLGSGVIWHQLASSTSGLLIAIVGSAYIGSGLLAARMTFFRERLRRWQSAPTKPVGLRVRN